MTDTACSVALPGSSPTRDGSGTRTTGVALQGKTLFKPLQPDGRGIGRGDGMVRHPQADAGGLDGTPMSRPAFPSRTTVSCYTPTSAGYARRRPGAIASPGDWFGHCLAQRTWLVAEPFGQHQGRSFGFLHRLAPGRAQIDTTYGNRFGRGTGEHWFSVGLRLLSPRFPP